MTTFEVFQALTPTEIELKQIYLDPNNPRFSDKWPEFVPDDAIEGAQARVEDLLVQNFGIDKLRMNMEVNGFLAIDRIIVREFAPGKYVALEGNRRICAAHRTVRYAQTSGVKQQILDTLKVIPCLQYVGDDPQSATWILQGIRHITGISDWSSYNKAKLLVEQMEEEKLTLTEVGRPFGLSAHGAGQWVRGYKAYLQAKTMSDYADVVSEESYLFFQELFSQSSIPMREWMDWDDDAKEFKNDLNFNEFVGWLYPKPEDKAEAPGNWDERWLAKRDDVRSLAELIRHDYDQFLDFRNNGNLEAAYNKYQLKKIEEQAKKQQDVVADTFDALDTCIKALENIPFRMVTDGDIKPRLVERLKLIETFIVPLTT